MSGKCTVKLANLGITLLKIQMLSEVLGNDVGNLVAAIKFWQFLISIAKFLNSVSNHHKFNCRANFKNNYKNNI
jgi:hypothetical protein